MDTELRERGFAPDQRRVSTAEGVAGADARYSSAEDQHTDPSSEVLAGRHPLSRSAFASLDEADRELLLANADRRTFAQGDQVIEEGSRLRALLVIRRGAVRVEHTRFNRAVVTARLGENDTLGELSLLGSPAGASVIADEDQVELYVLPVERMEALFASNPLLAARVYRSLATVLAYRLRDVASLLPVFGPTLFPLSRSNAAEHSGPGDGVNVSPQVVAAVQDFRAELLRLELGVERQHLDDIQAQAHVDRACDTLLRALHLACAGGAAEGQRAGAFVLRETFPFLMRSASIDRWFTKPRGYAGDYFTIELMYRDEVRGEGRLGELIDRWALNSAPVRAVRNRRRLLAAAIRDVADKQRGAGAGPTLITSLASGPAREIFDVLNTSNPRDITATCVDIDSEALAFAAGLAEHHGVGSRITFVQDNVIHLAQGRGKTVLAPQHLIYSVGLIDYLKDEYVVAILTWMHNQLLPGGTAILGNFDASNPGRPFMDHVLQWKLIHRTAEELQSLFARSAFGESPVSVRVEAEGVNLFAFCTRGAETIELPRQTGTFAVLTV